MPDAADATAALSASQTTPTTGAYFFMGFLFLALTTLTSPPPPPRRRVASQGQRGRPVGCHTTIKKPGLLGGPRLGLPDAARSRDFKSTRKALLPRFCTADCGNGLWRARGVGLGWEQLRGGGGVRRRIRVGPGDLNGGDFGEI